MATDILIVDDEADIRDLVADILRDHGYAPRTAESSDAALRAIAERVPALLILDIWLQGSELDGLGILEIAHKKYPHVPVVMISGHGNIETAVSAIRAGAYDYVEKPFKEDRLLMTVAKALEMARLKSENAELKERGSFELNLIGQSSAMVQVRQAVQKVASTTSRVLITGAAGTGKEMVARQIHAHSPRAAQPFVCFVASGIPVDRLEEELLGMEDGRQNGMVEKLGLFERAHGGTLFIDELADLPLEIQGKLLRILQEGAFTRLKGTRRVEVDVRVIAASSRDLLEEIACGALREDLYYRLNVVPIRMSRLRERSEDIPALCEYFLKRAAVMAGTPMRELGQDAIAALQAYVWPGNLSELKNMMEWLSIMAVGDASTPVGASMLPQEILYSNPVMERPSVNADIMALDLREARELFERQYLAAQIARFGGNISKTSAFVGMERSALHRKLKMLGLAKEEERLEKAS